MHTSTDFRPNFSQRFLTCTGICIALAAGCSDNDGSRDNQPLSASGSGGIQGDDQTGLDTEGTENHPLFPDAHASATTGKGETNSNVPSTTTNEEISGTTGTLTDTTSCDSTSCDALDGGIISTVEKCGNGILESGEACDLGIYNADNSYCRSDCILQQCGDGFVGPGESCDDGNNNDNDECSNQCKLASCGDGIVQPGEQCDDSNTDNTDDCLNTCVFASCGDGFIHTDNEECDFATLPNTDECTMDCKFSQSPTCGNEEIDAGEVCLGELKYYTLGFKPSRGHVVDGFLQQDGRPELVVVSPENFRLHLYYFEDSAPWTANMSQDQLEELDGGWHNVSSGDFDGDTQVDIVTLAPNHVAIWNGDAQSILSDFSHDTLPDSESMIANYLAVSDFDHNGKDDLVLYRKKTGDEEFGSIRLQFDGLAEEHIELPVDLPVTGAIAAGDINGDEHPEIIVATADQKLRIITYDGDNAESPLAVAQEIELGTVKTPRRMVLADVDSDGFNDVIFTLGEDEGLSLNEYFDGRVAIYYGGQAGDVPTLETHIKIEAQKYPYGLAVADMNHDGHPDVVVGNYASDSVSFILQDEESMEDWKTGSIRHFTTNAGRGATDVAVADFDQNGTLDVFTVHPQNHSLRLRRSNP